MLKGPYSTTGNYGLWELCEMGLGEIPALVIVKTYWKPRWMMESELEIWCQYKRPM